MPAQMMTLPELEGRAGYWDAQHRHLRAVRYVREHRPELLSKRFFLLVGACPIYSAPTLCPARR